MKNALILVGSFLGSAILAFAVAMTAAVMLKVHVQEAKLPDDTVMVIVHAVSMPPGLVIEEDDLYAVQIPPRYLPEGVFLSPEDVLGRRASEPVLANEFARAPRLRHPGDLASFRGDLKATLSEALERSDPEELMLLAERMARDPAVNPSLAQALARHLSLTTPRAGVDRFEDQLGRYARWCTLAGATEREAWPADDWTEVRKTWPRLPEAPPVARCTVASTALEPGDLDQLLSP